LSHADKILRLLMDGKPHYSSEFRDELALLEYRQPVTQLRRRGYKIVQKDEWIRTNNGTFRRSTYQLGEPCT